MVLPKPLCRCASGPWGNVLIKPVTDDRNRNFGFIAENKLYGKSGRLIGKMSGNLVVSEAGVPVGEVNSGVLTLYRHTTLRTRASGWIRAHVLRINEPAATNQKYKTPES